MSKIFTASNGVEYPVSDNHLVYPDGWSQQEEDRVLARWQDSEELTDAERVYLDAWTNRKNLNNCAKVLDGKMPTDYFGPEGTLDMVHGVAWSPDVCEDQARGKGCRIEYVWNHHSLDQPANIEHHPHRQHKVCSRHSHLDGDIKTHHDVVHKETRHKEDVLSAITKMAGLQDFDRPEWRFNESHELELNISGHSTLNNRFVKDFLGRKFPGKTIRVV